jgi:hypothetical protein
MKDLHPISGPNLHRISGPGCARGSAATTASREAGAGFASREKLLAGRAGGVGAEDRRE